MIRLTVIALLAGCGFEHGAFEAAPTVTIVDDSAADFAAGSATDFAVDKLGMLAPEAYALGGLHARGYAGVLVTDTTTWTNLQPQLTAPLGERFQVAQTDFAYDRPFSLGLGPSRMDNYTVAFDGEIYFDAGMRTLQVNADDIGFVEIDLGNIRPSVVAHVIDAQPARITFDVPAAGWYPVRGAMSEINGAAYVKLGLVENGTPRPLNPTELRARTTDAPGVIVSASADRLLTAPVPGTALERTLLDRTFTNAVPDYDFPSINNSNYSLRYVGQLRIDEAGPCVFAFDLGADTNDYARLFIDGAPVSGRWNGMNLALTSEAVNLTPGWHDIIVDYAQLQNVARVKLTMSTPTQAAAPIAPERLRPVRHGGLIAGFARNEYINLVDAGALAVDMKVDGPAGATVQFADAYFELSNEARSELTAALVHPMVTDGLPLPAAPAYENFGDYFPYRTAVAHAPVVTATGSWQLVLTDTVANTAGNIHYPALAVTYRGGPDMPFAQAMTYVSAPHHIDGTVSAIRTVGELDGASLTIEARTGTLDTIEDAPWQPSDAALSPGDTVQYRLTATSDGWSYPTIDRVEIDVAP